MRGRRTEEVTNGIMNPEASEMMMVMLTGETVKVLDAMSKKVKMTIPEIVGIALKEFCDKRR